MTALRIDVTVPPETSAAGAGSDAGLAGGAYACAPGATIEARRFVFDGWEGQASLSADFGDGTVSRCVGSIGDFAVRTAVAPASRGNVRHDIADYEEHLGAQPFGTGRFEVENFVEVTHPSRTFSGTPRSFWGGTFPNKPAADGNLRLVARFAGAYFEEDDGSLGKCFGSVVGLSDTLPGSNSRSPR